MTSSRRPLSTPVMTQVRDAFHFNLTVRRGETLPCNRTSIRDVASEVKHRQNIHIINNIAQHKLYELQVHNVKKYRLIKMQEENFHEEHRQHVDS